jgi:hypothetical protein
MKTLYHVTIAGGISIMLAGLAFTLNKESISDRKNILDHLEGNAIIASLYKSDMILAGV